MLRNCSVYPTIFKEKHRYCGTPNEIRKLYNSSECPDFRWFSYGHCVELLHKICNLRNVLAMKVIRLQCLSDLLKIGRNTVSKIKIIHLLRDPRSMINSRKTGVTFFGWSTEHRLFYDDSLTIAERLRNPDYNWKHSFEAYEYCKKEMKNLKLMGNGTSLFSGYMMTTHKALSSEPLKILKKIYNFLGLPLLENVLTSMNEMSHGKSSEKVIDRALNTNKVSEEIIGKWLGMLTLKFNQIRQIEDNCGELLKRLNLKYVLDKTNSQYFLSDAGVKPL